MNKSELTYWINPVHLNTQQMSTYRSEFAENLPFSHLNLNNFLVEERIQQLVNALSDQQFLVQESDLFQFAQTPDFDELEAAHLLDFKSFFQSGPFLDYLHSITGIEVGTDVDMLGNIYRDTDYLLCHDDQLSGRRIAYILYLTDLGPEDGGALELFESHDGKPHQVVRTIRPEYNQLVLFKVTPISFHQVTEILGPDIFRVSISGWFNND